MTWNYRIVRYRDPESDTGIRYEVKEVYYDGQREPWAYCDASLVGDSIDELRKTLDQITTAMDKPILDNGDFTLGGNDNAQN